MDYSLVIVYIISIYNCVNLHPCLAKSGSLEPQTSAKWSGGICVCIRCMMITLTSPPMSGKKQQPGAPNVIQKVYGSCIKHIHKHHCSTWHMGIGCLPTFWMTFGAPGCHFFPDMGGE